MKKRLIGFSLILMMLAIIANSTIAYFTDQEEAINVITAGNIKIELNEMMKNENGDLIAYQNDMIMVPNTTISKIVTVTNSGNQDAYVRIEVEKFIQTLNANNNLDPSVIEIAINDEMWKELDGYYYYQAVLKPQQQSEPLFNEVYFRSDMGNEYQNCKAIIDIYAYSVQAKNNGNNVMEAKGWPTKGGNE